jgi:hypothetical protein
MTRLQWAVVVGLVVVAAFGIFLFQLWPSQQPSSSHPPAFLLEERASVRNALSTAQEEALRWQTDSQLSSAGIVWDDLGPGGLLKCDRWTFHFYSPSQQRMLILRVVDGRAERLRVALVPQPLPILSLDQWKIDSTEALRIWWEQGGEEFVRQHTDVTINLKLRTEPGGTRAVWSVVGASSEAYRMIQLDSRDGSIIG